MPAHHIHMTTNLTYLHLTFHCIAQTPIRLDHHWAGNRLRGALGYILLRNTCSQKERKSTPNHAANCPACWLLSHKLDPGHARRAYSIVPPIPPRQTIQPNQPFSFTITLFGNGRQYLPYFVLAVGEMGRTGVGGRHRHQRGTFTLDRITTRNPLTRQQETLLTSGENLVKIPQINIAWDDALSAPIAPPNSQLTLRFLTPIRLIHHRHLAKQPQFNILFRRLLHRIDTLGTQFAHMPRRSDVEIEQLHAHADQVQLIQNTVEWIDLRPRSGRDRQHKPISGFVGVATYHASNWKPLLPYLIFGQGIQVGKSATKGNGVYQLQQETAAYWHNSPLRKSIPF